MGFSRFSFLNKNLLYVIAETDLIRNKCNLDGFKELIAQTTAFTENEVMIKAFEQQVRFVPGIVPVLRRLCNYSFTKYGIKEPIITSRKHHYNIIWTWYFNNTYKGTAKPIIHETKEPVIIVRKRIVTKQDIEIYSQISNTTGGYTRGDIHQHRKTRYTIRNRKPRGRPAWINDTTKLGCYRFEKQPSSILHTARAPTGTYDSIANS